MSDQTKPAESVEDVLSLVESSWQRLKTLVFAIPEERAEEPGVCGPWSAKIVVGHVAFWNEFETRRFQSEGGFGSTDWQALNDQNEKDNQDRSFAEIREQLVTSHDALMAVVIEKASLLPVQIRELVYDHYVEHAAELETWLARA